MVQVDISYITVGHPTNGIAHLLSSFMVATSSMAWTKSFGGCQEGRAADENKQFILTATGSDFCPL